MGRRIRAVLTLYRWDSSFALAVLFLAASPQPARAASLAGAIAWFFAAAGAYALNDAMDVEIDRVNHAERPVPAGGELSVGAAEVAATIAFVAALLAAAFGTGLLKWILPCPVVALLFCIVVRKRSSLASNVLASAGVACIPLSAAPLRGSPGFFVVPLLAFVVMLARELPNGPSRLARRPHRTPVRCDARDDAPTRIRRLSRDPGAQPRVACRAGALATLARRCVGLPDDTARFRWRR